MTYEYQGSSGGIVLAAIGLKLSNERLRVLKYPLGRPDGMGGVDVWTITVCQNPSRRNVLRQQISKPKDARRCVKPCRDVVIV